MITNWLLSPYNKISTICPACGTKCRIDYNFCPSCKTRLDTKFVACSQCHRNIDPTAKFCPYCQAPVDQARAIREATVIVWKRLPKQFARRLDLNFHSFGDKEFRAQGFLVEYGTKALLIVDGVLANELEPGRYVEFLGKDAEHRELEVSEEEKPREPKPDRRIFDLISRAQKFASVVLVQSTDIDLSFLYGPPGDERAQNFLLTKDNLQLGIDFKLTARFAKPANFYQTFYKTLASNDDSEKESVLVEEDLVDHFYDEIRDAIREEVIKYPAEELINANRQFKDIVEGNLMTIIRRSAGRAGMEIIQIRAAFVAQDAIRELMLRRGQLELGRKRLELIKDFGALENQKKLVDAANVAQLEKAMLDIDRQRVMSKEEYAELKAAFADGRGNREMTMRLLQAKLQIMFDVERERLDLVEKGKLKSTAIDIQIAQSRKVKEFEYEQQLRQVETKAAGELKELEVWKRRVDAHLHAKQKDVQIDVDQYKQRIQTATEALAKLSPETAALYLAQNPEAARVLIERAKAAGNVEIVKAYEKSVEQIKDVAKIAVGNQGFVVPGFGQSVVGFGRGSGGTVTCPNAACGCSNIQAGMKFCPQCGTKLS